MEYPLAGILNGSAVIADGANFKNVRMLRANHLSGESRTRAILTTIDA